MDLPKELVRAIADSLEEADIRVARATCKSWHKWIPQTEFKLNIRPSDNLEELIQRLQQNPDLLTLQFNKTNYLLALKIRDSGLHTITKLKRLVMQQDPLYGTQQGLGDSDPCDAFLGFRDLNEYTLSRFTQLEHLSAAQVSFYIILKLTNLTSLHLTNSHSFDLAEILLTLTKLRDVSLIKCKKLITSSLPTNSTLTRLVVLSEKMPGGPTNLMNLKELELRTIEGEHMEILSVPLTTLESLTLHGYTEQAALQTIPLNTNLTRIDVTGGFNAEDYPPDSFEAWSKLTKLQVLRLRHFGLFSMAAPKNFEFFTNLTSLAEFHALMAVDPAAEVLPYLNDSLTRLVIGYTGWIDEDDADDAPTDPQVSLALSRFHNLKELAFEMRSYKLDDLHECTRLTSLELDLGSCKVSHFERMTQLKTLNVSFVSKRAFDYSTVAHLLNLENLVICAEYSTQTTVDLNVISALTKLQRFEAMDSHVYSGLHVLSNLTALFLHSRATVLNEIGQLTNLRALALSQEDNAAYLKSLTCLQSLQKLTLLRQLRRIEPQWRWYTALTQLRVIGSPVIDASNLAEWSRSLPHLVAYLKY